MLLHARDKGPGKRSSLRNKVTLGCIQSLITQQTLVHIHRLLLGLQGAVFATVCFGTTDELGGSNNSCSSTRNTAPLKKRRKGEIWYNYKVKRKRNDGDDDSGEAQRARLVLMSSAEPNGLRNLPVSENSSPFRSVCSTGIFTESN